jgi:hypothetical protein
MTKADAVVIAAIEAGVPSLIEARALVDQFHDMIRKKDEAKLDVWIENAKRSLVSSFATGVLKDRAAVRAAIIQPWSNGQVEAQITKLKLVKRQNVWPSENRPSRSTTARDCLIRDVVIKYASDPNIDPVYTKLIRHLGCRSALGPHADSHLVPAPPGRLGLASTTIAVSSSRMVAKSVGVTRLNSSASSRTASL